MHLCGKCNVNLIKYYKAKQCGECWKKSSPVPWNSGKKGVQVAWNKGKKMGKNPRHSEWLKENPISYWKGKTRSVETKLKISKTRTGKLLGSKNPAWTGGNSRKYRNGYYSKMYVVWRNKVFERDDYTCQSCGKLGVELNADHEMPRCRFPELQYEVLNGRTLCVTCHKKTPTWGYYKRPKSLKEELIQLNKSL